MLNGDYFRCITFKGSLVGGPPWFGDIESCPHGFDNDLLLPFIFSCFMDIFLVYSFLEGFRTSFQDYHKTSCVFFILVEFSIMLKLFSNLFLKTPTHRWVVGWATMPCMLWEDHLGLET